MPHIKTSPAPVSRTSVETTDPPNELGSIFKQLDILVCDANSVEKNTWVTYTLKDLVKKHEDIM